MMSDEALSQSDYHPNRGVKLVAVAPQWILCLIGGLLIWQLITLNEKIERQNELLRATKDSTAAGLFNVMANVGAIASHMPYIDNESMRKLVSEVQKIREATEKQDKKKELK
jgi:hypothetical protein